MFLLCLHVVWVSKSRRHFLLFILDRSSHVMNEGEKHVSITSASSPVGTSTVVNPNAAAAESAAVTTVIETSVNEVTIPSSNPTSQVEEPTSQLIQDDSNKVWENTL